MFDQHSWREHWQDIMDSWVVGFVHFHSILLAKPISQGNQHHTDQKGVG